MLKTMPYWSVLTMKFNLKLF